jgi:hypothetical protein
LGDKAGKGKDEEIKIMKRDRLQKMEMYIVRTGIEKYGGMKKRWIEIGRFIMGQRR